jgi:hypothetical protein
VTVPAVVAKDDDAEHGVVEQWRSDPQIVKSVEVADFIPVLVAVRVYPMPCLLIDKLENEAIPPVTVTLTVPDKDPEPGFDLMATVTTAFEPVTSWPDASTTSTLTGPPWEAKAEVITAPAAVPAGSAPFTNASEQDPAPDPSPDPVHVLVDVDPAAGTASIATPSMLAASTPRNIRPTLKPALYMRPPLCRTHRSTGEGDRGGVPAVS